MAIIWRCRPLSFLTSAVWAVCLAARLSLYDSYVVEWKLSGE